MSEENFRELFRALREAQTRYTYFLLAASGAAIGLALNQTRESMLTWYQVPIGLAVLAWALSFFFGCRHLVYVSSNLYSNAELLRIQGGGHPQLGRHPGMIAAASDGIREALESNSKRANFFGRAQFALLVVGAVLYVAWHIGQMYTRTIAG